MPYLSMIPLNPLRRKTGELVRNPQKLHAAVLGGIAKQPVAERVLWRIEHDEHAWRVLVLSQSLPAWDHLIEQAGWPGADVGEARVASYDPLLALVMKGRRFQFRVRANPASSTTAPTSPTATQAMAVEGGRAAVRGLRVGHRTHAHQLAWFLARTSGESDRWGFTVEQRDRPLVDITQRERLSFFKKGMSAPVTLNVATFEGLLEVTNPNRFTDVLLGGLGGGKAYGCGLLTIAGVESDVVDC